MQISINIKNIGNAIGTVGWLEKKAHTIKIGPSNTGNQCAWLLDAEGKRVTLLAMREFGVIERAINNPAYSVPWTTDIMFTDSAFTALSQLIDIAVDEMERIESEHPVINFTVSKA